MTTLLPPRASAEFLDLARHSAENKDQGVFCICSRCEPRGWLTPEGEIVSEVAPWPGKRLSTPTR